jgi:hypothetical protein
MIGGGFLKEPFTNSFSECRELVQDGDQYLFRDCATLNI